MTATMNGMQAHLNTLSTMSSNTTIPKSKSYCWVCRKKITHGRNNIFKKKVHQKDAYYKKRFRFSEKGCKFELGVIMNKIKIRNTKISLMNIIGTQNNSPSKCTLSIADSNTNIHLANEANTTMSAVIVSN